MWFRYETPICFKGLWTWAHLMRIKPLQAKCQSMRLLAWRRRNVILFLALFAHENTKQKHHPTDYFTLALFTNNLIFVSFCLYVLDVCGRSSRRAIQRLYSAAQTMHNGPPTKWLRIVREWESQFSVYTIHNEKTTAQTGPGHTRCARMCTSRMRAFHCTG